MSADSRRRVEVEAAALVAQLNQFAGWEPLDSPRAVTMRRAAETLRALAPPPRAKDSLEDSELEVQSYSTEISDETKEMRLALYGDSGQRNLLAYLILDPPGTYEFGADILRIYDKLEGI